MVEVGKYYNVPACRLKVFKRNFWFAILHDHVGDISGERHCHIDVRFMSDYLLKMMSFHEAGIIACDTSKTSAYAIKRMLCHRKFKPIDMLAMSKNQKEGIKTLKDRFKDRVLDKTKMTCPHQGCDLSEAAIEDGAICCPCHGLQWDEKTGKMR